MPLGTMMPHRPRRIGGTPLPCGHTRLDAA